jgi:uncharacterized RDD family membrane protein YckC
MLCVACGGDVQAGSRFCPRCGRAVNTTGPGTAPPTGPPPPPGGLPAEPPTMPPPPPPPPPPPLAPPPPPGAYGPAPGYPPPPAAGGGTSGPVAYGLAGIGQRLGAVVIDGIVMAVVYIFGIVVAVMTTPSATFDNPEPSPNALGMFVLLLSWLGTMAYPIYFEGRPEGQTPGKKALGIRVVRRVNGAPLGYGLAFGRFLARIVESFTFGIGLLIALWDPLRQTLHDKMAGTLVVRSDIYPPP